MTSVGERLKHFWLAQGMQARSGAAEPELQNFESRYGVQLPPDLREYFAVVDGGDGTFSFDDKFLFWPLAEVERASDWYRDQFLGDQSSYFVFADYLLQSRCYAIQLTPQGGQKSLVIGISSFDRNYEVDIMADSFSEFAERYLADDMSRLELGLGLPRGALEKYKVFSHPIADQAHPLWDRDLDS
jgi:hypothetical protein